MWRSLDREDSEFNEGWRFGVACGAAAILLGLLLLMIGLAVAWVSPTS